MKSAMDANTVAGYLKSHPEFFENYADLLAQVLVPNPHAGNAISITERQISTLRERAKKLEAKLAELIHFGEENDAIAEKLHRLALALIGANDFAAVLNALYASLGEDFAVPHLALRLWGVAVPGEEDREEFTPPDEAILALAAKLKHPNCGPSAGFESWLGPRVRSLALVPIRHGDETVGLLALGSEEAQRFHAGMETLFLARLGDMVTAALLRGL